MRRGDLVTVTIKGDYGKPRPALVIQSDVFNDTHASVTIILISSEIIDAPLFRITVEPAKNNNLRIPCQIMVDKVMTVRKEKIGSVFGNLEDKTLLQINRSLTVFLGIA